MPDSNENKSLFASINIRPYWFNKIFRLMMDKWPIPTVHIVYWTKPTATIYNDKKMIKFSFVFVEKLNVNNGQFLCKLRFNFKHQNYNCGNCTVTVSTRNRRRMPVIQKKESYSLFFNQSESSFYADADDS